MKVFSKEKFIEQEGIQRYNYSKTWVDKCDGKNVVNGRCTIDPETVYHIRDCWCVECPAHLADAVEKAYNMIKAAITKGKQRPKYQIIIASDGDTTTATMTINGVEVKKAQTKRNPKDKPNWKIGAQMAFGRLWDTEKKKNQRFNEVKRHAMVGEYIKIVKPLETGNYYKQDDIRRVCHLGSKIGRVYIDGSPVPVDECEYVVLEGMAEHVAGGGKCE